VSRCLAESRTRRHEPVAGNARIVGRSGGKPCDSLSDFGLKFDVGFHRGANAGNLSGLTTFQIMFYPMSFISCEKTGWSGK